MVVVVAMSLYRSQLAGRDDAEVRAVENPVQNCVRCDPTCGSIRDLLIQPRHRDCLPDHGHAPAVVGGSMDTRCYCDLWKRCLAELVVAIEDHTLPRRHCVAY